MLSAPGLLPGTAWLGNRTWTAAGQQALFPASIHSFMHPLHRFSLSVTREGMGLVELSSEPRGRRVGALRPRGTGKEMVSLEDLAKLVFP